MFKNVEEFKKCYAETVNFSVADWTEKCWENLFDEIRTRLAETGSYQYEVKACNTKSGRPELLNFKVLYVNFLIKEEDDEDYEIDESKVFYIFNADEDGVFHVDLPRIEEN